MVDYFRGFNMKVLLLLLFPVLSWSTCPVFNSNNVKVKNLHDGVFYVLNHSKECPRDVVEWNEAIEHAGLEHQASMVANRGRNNPKLGSFSLFEVVTGEIKQPQLKVRAGEFFYGHFTHKINGTIEFDQSPTQGKLLLELIAWDKHKKNFNFYELVGIDNKTVRWFYRGDSLDALADNQFLHRDPGDQPKFGARMRCSACHNSGGPIMKELSYPHNDWWTSQRSLIFGDASLDVKLSAYIAAILPAEKFANAVQLGRHKLASSQKYQLAKSQLSLPEQLRPIFCEQEINLVSDLTPNENMQEMVQIPSAFFQNPLLGDRSIFISRASYVNMLKKYQLKFPETNDIDSDHAWLTPVKGQADLLAIQQLIEMNVVSSKFVHAILKVDAGNPIFSKQRCALLKKVPLEKYQGWEDEFLNELQGLQSVSMNFDLESSFQKLLQVREEISNNEISHNPLGQILEPGFRVIFPTKL